MYYNVITINLQYKLIRIRALQCIFEKQDIKLPISQEDYFWSELHIEVTSHKVFLITYNIMPYAMHDIILNIFYYIKILLCFIYLACIIG